MVSGSRLAPLGLGSFCLALAASLLASACFTDSPVTGQGSLPRIEPADQDLIGPGQVPSDVGPDAADAGGHDTPLGDGGSDGQDGSDMGAGDEPSPAECPNGVTEEGEDCDDNNDNDDDFCLSDCRFACGDGVVNSVERCDSAIAANEPGACPTVCQDNDACTSDLLTGTGCDVRCVFSDITAIGPLDGCCPEAADATTDPDCAADCGNGVVESGESCDIDIVDGEGACPAACADSLACTRDVLDNPGTCQATCRFEPIGSEDIGDDDGCCPEGATTANDPDCSVDCGDGVVDAPAETCDTAIAPNEVGACPTACPSTDACVERTLVGAGTCQAACSDRFITTPGDADGCCPPSGNANNDPDCEPECGNGVIEPPDEQCDEGPDLPSNGCDLTCQLESPPPTSFRIDSLALRAPHAVTSVPIFGCVDVTGTINGQIDDAVSMDGDDDGFIDLSFLLTFRPLDQVGPSGDVDLALGMCSVGDVCTIDPDTIVQALTYDNVDEGVCLEPVAGTFNPGWTPPITPTTADSGPCFVTEEFSLAIDVGGIIIPLESARAAANYAGNPASSLQDGLLTGFLSEAAASAVILPSDIPVVGGSPLSELLPGATDCSGADDRVSDGPPDGMTTGWWFYLNYTAEDVELIE